GLVKTARQRDRCFIAHFELHCDHRGDAFENKTLGHAREGIASRSSCAFTGIENHQAHGRIPQENAEFWARYVPPESFLGFEAKHTLLECRIEAPVPDKVKNVTVPTPNAILQLAERGPGQALHY